jgi:ADP-heptose:LPS heptosyltransferase
MSLPLAFKTDLASIPSPMPYLKGLEEKKVQWRGKLGAKSKKRIGLVWSGSTGHGNDKSRSMSLRQMLEGLPAQFEYVSLQKEVRQVDEPYLKQSGLKHFGAELEDFVDTAALCELMDVVICVDTSVAHLSAALGCKTFIVLPYVPDWRWLVDRSDCPWYGSVKLVRQSSNRSWHEVLHQVSAHLRELDASGS